MATVTEPEALNGDSSFSLSNSLDTLTQSLSGAVSSLPASKAHDGVDASASNLTPADGISLLDTKNEIFLSYLQNLVLLLVLQLRDRAPSSPEGKEGKGDSSLQGEVRRKLAELRVYLERGVRPLEGKLKYQVDKVLKAAENAERSQQQAALKSGKKDRKTKAAESDGSGSDDGSESGSGSEDEENESGADSEEIDEMAYRPNLSAFAKDTREPEEAKRASKNVSSDGIYRPPRIKPTALPQTTSSDRRADREARRTAKSAVIDEFVNAEMSSAPMAQPSIGSTIRQFGRTVRSEKERERENERRAYEETNFVRLPKETKKERAKRGGDKTGGYGGEEWRGLGEGADRIARLTKRGKSSGGALEKSRKRRATEDGPRGDGVNIGERFEKRRKKIEGWKR